MSDRQWQWVTSDEALRAAIDALMGEAAVAIDTEFRRRDTFYPQVALIQMATQGQCWLIDPLTLSDPAPLKQLLLNPDVIKVLHSASEDLEVFERWLGVLPQPLFDSQKAAAMLNMGFGLSYRALVEQMLGITVDKEETQSDWLARPLTDNQESYAAQDVIYLAELFPELLKKVAALGRLDWVLEEGREAATGGRGPLAKFKSAWKLSAAQQAAIAALVEWREGQAQQRDKPRGWVLNDKVITELARKMPEHSRELETITGLPQGLVRRAGEAMITLINNPSEEARLAAISAFQKPPTSDIKARAKALGAHAEALAGKLGMNVEITVPNRELELIVSDALNLPIVRPSSWSGWRGEWIIGPLLQQASRMNEINDETS